MLLGLELVLMRTEDVELAGSIEALVERDPVAAAAALHVLRLDDAQDRRFEILSAPSMLVPIDKGGSLFVGRSVPVVTGTEVDEEGGSVTHYERVRQGISFVVTASEDDGETVDLHLSLTDLQLVPERRSSDGVDLTGVEWTGAVRVTEETTVVWPASDLLLVVRTVDDLDPLAGAARARLWGDRGALLVPYDLETHRGRRKALDALLGE
jgi:hypothetical protein